MNKIFRALHSNKFVSINKKLLSSELFVAAFMINRVIMSGINIMIILDTGERQEEKLTLEFYSGTYNFYSNQIIIN